MNNASSRWACSSGRASRVQGGNYSETASRSDCGGGRRIRAQPGVRGVPAGGAGVPQDGKPQPARNAHSPLDQPDGRRDHDPLADLAVVQVGRGRAAVLRAFNRAARITNTCSAAVRLRAAAGNSPSYFEELARHKPIIDIALAGARLRRRAPGVSGTAVQKALTRSLRTRKAGVGVWEPRSLFQEAADLAENTGRPPRERFATYRAADVTPSSARTTTRCSTGRRRRRRKSNPMCSPTTTFR